MVGLQGATPLGPAVPMSVLPEGLPSLRAVVERHGLAARKSLGQHFLLDQAICDRIVRLAGDLSGVHVVEVGPGPGGLTRALVGSDAASVSAIELDARAVAACEDLAAAVPGRLVVVAGDALRVRVPDLVASPRAIVANLPYNAGTPLLVRWLAEAGCYRCMVLMFQLEVAARLVAAPDSAAYGRLSVLTQLVCEASIVMRLPASVFSPPPKVESAVVRLVPRPEQPRAALFAAIERVTAAAFGQRRKMLRVALKSVGGADLLERAGIDGTRRGETLSVAEFVALAELTLRPA